MAGGIEVTRGPGSRSLWFGRHWRDRQRAHACVQGQPPKAPFRQSLGSSGWFRGLGSLSSGEARWRGARPAT
jgi:hypothetical protein